MFSKAVHSTSSQRSTMVQYGYLSREYADRHLGAFTLQKPPQLENISLAPHQGNHSFVVIGKRAEIIKWLKDEQPNMKVFSQEVFPWKKNTPYTGVVKCTMRSVHTGNRFVYLALGKKLTSTLMLEFSPWDGKYRESEPMPIDRTHLDAIPLKGESILVRSGTILMDVGRKLEIKRKVMDISGGVKVFGMRLERATTFSSVLSDKHGSSRSMDGGFNTKRTLSIRRVLSMHE
ncbi:hypothetical protein DFQ26_004156 [Actinomortierella ambigua]|nr:hypothetical protein DFQ26_004156 [Actinomortierella ambigua]